MSDNSINSMLWKIRNRRIKLAAKKRAERYEAEEQASKYKSKYTHNSDGKLVISSANHIISSDINGNTISQELRSFNPEAESLIEHILKNNTYSISGSELETITNDDGSTVSNRIYKDEKNGNKVTIETITTNADTSNKKVVTVINDDGTSTRTTIETDDKGIAGTPASSLILTASRLSNSILQYFNPSFQGELTDANAFKQINASYVYDALGNLFKQTENIDLDNNGKSDERKITQFSYNEGGQITQQIEKLDTNIDNTFDQKISTTFTYDAAGNVISKTELSDVDNNGTNEKKVLTELTYNSSNKLSQKTETIDSDNDGKNDEKNIFEFYSGDVVKKQTKIVDANHDGTLGNAGDTTQDIIYSKDGTQAAGTVINITS